MIACRHVDSGVQNIEDKTYRPREAVTESSYGVSPMFASESVTHAAASYIPLPPTILLPESDRACRWRVVVASAVYIVTLCTCIVRFYRFHACDLISAGGLLGHVPIRSDGRVSVSRVTPAFNILSTVPSSRSTISSHDL